MVKNINCSTALIITKCSACVDVHHVIVHAKFQDENFRGSAFVGELLHWSPAELLCCMWWRSSGHSCFSVSAQLSTFFGRHLMEYWLEITSVLWCCDLLVFYWMQCAWTECTSLSLVVCSVTVSLSVSGYTVVSRMVFSRKFVSRKVVSRMDIFPDTTFPGWSLSRKDVSRVVIFPDDKFPGKTSWMVGLMFNCSWCWSLTERPYSFCVYLNGFTVNSPYCQFAPLTNSSQVNMRRVGIQCYQAPVVLILSSGRHCHYVASI